MQNHQENGAVGAEDAPDFASVEGFVDEDDEEDAQDAPRTERTAHSGEIPITSLMLHPETVSCRNDAS